MEQNGKKKGKANKAVVNTPVAGSGIGVAPVTAGGATGQSHKNTGHTSRPEVEGAHGEPVRWVSKPSKVAYVVRARSRSMSVLSMSRMQYRVNLWRCKMPIV